MGIRVTQRDPKTTAHQSFRVEYAVARPEDSHIKAVATALVNGHVGTLKSALIAMQKAGFDPMAIHLEVPGSFSSGRAEPLLNWTLKYAPHPRRLFRAIVETDVHAAPLVNELIVQDGGSSCIERWAWKLILSRLPEAERWNAYPLEGQFDELAAEGEESSNRVHRGSAVHQAILSGKNELLPELLACVGPSGTRPPIPSTFSASQAILGRLSKPGSRFNWPDFLPALDEEELLALCRTPVKRPHMDNTSWPTLFAGALKATQSSASPGAQALTILVERLGVRLTPLLKDMGYARTADMKHPIFDRLDDILFQHEVALPRESQLATYARPIPIVSPRRSRVRS